MIYSTSSPAPLVPTIWPDPIPGIIPFGTITILAGAPGAGKTALLADWIRRWRNGGTIFDHPTNKPTGFYYLAADRQWKSHQQWFDLVDFPDIPHYSLADDPSFNTGELLKAYNALAVFHACLNKLNPQPGSHVFVDPVTPLFIAGDPNRARDVAYSLLNMSKEAQARQITLTMTGHFSKQRMMSDDQYTKPQDRISGSGAFSGFSDTQCYLVEPIPHKQPYHTFGWVPRHAPAAEFQLTRNSDGLFVPYDWMAEDKIASEVYECMPIGEVAPVEDIIEEAYVRYQHSRSTVKRALQRLLDQRRVVKMGRGKYQRARIH